ncbi:MAG: DUF4373 domain-containing protein [Eubacterium sp.]
MGRPKEVSLKYFSLDVNFFSNRKIKILKSRFGADGITVYFYILCEVYRDKGYYLEKNEDFIYIIADDLNMSIEKIEQILKFLFERSLLVEMKVDKASILFKSDTIITARSIQEQYQECTKGWKRDVEVIGDLWFLEDEKTAGHIKVTEKQVNPRKKVVNPGETTVNPGKTVQTKRKEIKQKEKKENNTGSVLTAHYENPELNQLFCDFLDLRKSMKVNNTDRAIKMLIKKIENYPDPVKIQTIEESIMNNWKGLFPKNTAKLPVTNNYNDENDRDKAYEELQSEQEEWLRTLSEET